MPEEPNQETSPANNLPGRYIAVGVLAVLLGGLLSTLNGRLLSVSLPDLRGLLSLSVEQSAWISTAYNMAVMFMGVFTVYLGALLGVRRVLLASACAYLATCLLLPFASGYPSMIVLQVVAGLSSGTFYPLTLSFILLNLPIRVVHWGLAAYSLSILFAVNIATETAGWLVANHSGRWIFWLLSCGTVAMWLCVYIGVPRTPLPKPNPNVRVSWRALLYWSFALAIFYGALDIGERVRWFDSPVFAALIATGVFLLSVSVLRHEQDPNPLLKLPFLRTRSTILLGIILFAFRFCVLSTALLIPQFLGGVRALRNEQVGPVLAITATLQFVLAWVVSSCLRIIDVRLVLAVGFATIGTTAFFCSHVDSAWAPSTFVLPAVLFAAGESLSIIGLVGAIIMQIISTGAVGISGKPQRPLDVLTYSSFFHTVRILGGQVGTVLMLHVLTERTKFHVAILGQHTEPARLAVSGLLRGVTSFESAVTTDPSHALGVAVYTLGASVQRQAATLAYADAFTILACSSVGVLLLAMLVRLSFSRFKDLL